MEKKLSQLTVIQVLAAHRRQKEHETAQRSSSNPSPAFGKFEERESQAAQDEVPDIVSQYQDNLITLLGQGGISETLQNSANGQGEIRSNEVPDIASQYQDHLITLLGHESFPSTEACGYFNMLDLNVTHLGATETRPRLVSEQYQDIDYECNLNGLLKEGKGSENLTPLATGLKQSQGRGRGRRAEYPSSSVSRMVLKNNPVKSHWNEPVTGRGRLLSNKLEESPKWTLKIYGKDNKIISESSQLPQKVNEVVQKNVVCNTVPFKSKPVFEYTLSFLPEIKSVTRRNGFLKKHFFKLDKPFMYNHLSIFVPTLLQDHELTCSLTDSSTADLYTMKLTFKHTVNFKSHPELLCRLFEDILEGPESKIILDYSIQIRANLLCLNYQCYHLEENDVSDIALNFARQFHERSEQCLNYILKNARICCNNKIYKMLGVNWPNQTLELYRNNLQTRGKFKDCKIAEKIASIHQQTPKEFISNLKKAFSSDLFKKNWNIEFGDFTKAKARVLKSETIVFGEGVEYTPTDGNWEKKMLENEVFIATELSSWMILYTAPDLIRVERLTNNIENLQNTTGLTIGKPLLFEIDSDTKDGYVDALNDVIYKELQFIVVIIPRSSNKPESLIKHICCIKKPIPYQLINALDVDDPLKIHQITLQLNLISGGIPWTVKLPYRNWMVCGIDLTDDVCSFVTALSSDASQWYSKAIFIKDTFLNCLYAWLDDTLQKYQSTNGRFPSHLLIYQNCTQETRQKFYDDYENFNLENINVCVILVERQTNISIYKDLKSGVDYVPPGTIVDNTIINPIACDFFLTSATNCCTYYDVIKDTSGLSDEQLETVTYKMCHLFYKCAKTVEAPAPCLYAEKLSNLITKEINCIPSSNLDELLYYL